MLCSSVPREGSWERIRTGRLKMLNLFAGVATTKYPGLGGINHRDLYSPSSEGQKSEIKGVAGLFSSQIVPFGLQMAASCRVLTRALFTAHTSRSLCPNFLLL